MFFRPGAPPQYSVLASSRRSASGLHDTTLNGPLPIGLLKKPCSFSFEAGAIGTSVILASNVPTGALVLISTVESSGVAILSTCANNGATGPFWSITRCTTAFTSAEENGEPS